MVETSISQAFGTIETRIVEGLSEESGASQYQISLRSFQVPNHFLHHHTNTVYPVPVPDLPRGSIEYPRMPIITASSNHSSEGGLGQSLCGEKITINTTTTVLVKELLGEGKMFYMLTVYLDFLNRSPFSIMICVGGFAYVYLVRDISDSGDDAAPKRASRTSSFNSKLMLNNQSSNASEATATPSTTDSNNDSTNNKQQPAPRPTEMVLKVTSISSRQQRDIAEKEARLLAKLSHPSIVKMFDTAYRTIPISSSHPSSGHHGGGGLSSAFRSHKVNHNNASGSDQGNGDNSTGMKQKERTQHMILMEYCEGGHALHVCSQLKQKNERFDLSTLIIAFGQICNAVSYLHAQRPPIVHRDLKPENFLIKGGAYKLCDFGSAIFGHVELKTSKDRHDEEEVIEKTTTQMFRAPEMVDLFMSKKLTQATDVWALGCCLYALAYLKNCFEEGSNLAIISRNYKIPDDNIYGDGLVELIDRMLTQDAKCRADMTEVILCLSAVYSGKPLPPRKERKTKERKEKESSIATTTAKPTNETEDLTIRKTKEAKKLDPNSAAARRRQAAAAVAGVDPNFTSFSTKFESHHQENDDLAFSTTQNPFADFDGSQVLSSGINNNNNNAKKDSDGTNIFGSFTDMDDGAVSPNDEILQAFSASSADWDSKPNTPQERGRSTVGKRRSTNRQEPPKVRSRSQDHRRKSNKKDETPEEAIERLSALNLDDADDDDDDNGDDDRSMAESVMTKGGTVTKKLVARRGVRRMVSTQPRSSRSLSRGAGLRRTKSSNANADGQVAMAAASLYANSRNRDDDNDDYDDE